jgi:hypothetical protein
MNAQYGRCQEGLNDYQYRASLGICHPHLSAQAISDQLNLLPSSSHDRGDRRRTPKGTPLDGNYISTYWAKDLPAEGECGFGDFLAKFAADFAVRKEALNKIYDTGGRNDLYVQLFAKSLCDDIIPCELLAQLGELRVDLRLDYYAKSPSSGSSS